MKRMNIVVASSKKYIDYLIVMLTSLFENNKGYDIYIYLYHSEAIEVEVKRLEQYCAKYNARLVDCYVEPGELKLENNMRTSWSHFTLLRFRCIDDLKDVCDRVLVLGVDLVVNKEISDFYFQEFDGNLFAMCKDMGQGIGQELLLTKEKCGYDLYRGELNYCNADVCLINLKETGEKVTYNKLLDTCMKYEFKYIEQDTINYLYKDYIKVNDPYKYNFLINEVKENKEELISNAYIIHWASKKPWVNGPADYNSIWYEYAKKAGVFTEVILKSLEEINTENENYRKELNKYYLYYLMYFYLQKLYRNNRLISDEILKRGYGSIAIYGAGEIAEIIISESHDDLDIQYVIDKVRRGNIKNVNIINCIEKDKLEDVDCVIVTIPHEFDSIKNMLCSKYSKNVSVIAINDILCTG